MQRRIFIMGATGYLGSAIAARLKRSGNDVFGLTRSAERAKALAALGITPVVGDLATPRAFIGALKNCDAVVHAAAESGPRWAERDRDALDAIRSAAQDGRVRCVLYTSGVWVMGDTGDKVADESAAANPLALVRWRAAHEEVALDLGEHDTRAIIFRPGIVYGESRGIVGAMFAEAREKRTVTYPGTGEQRWCLVHRDDVAEAYALALEEGRTGERFILVDESRFTARRIAEAIAGATGATAVAWDEQDVRKRLGAYGEALLSSQSATAVKARRELGWVPRHASLVAEVAGLQREWQAQQTPVA
jgi:nucleoside-diphosphate-sugar epimerase